MGYETKDVEKPFVEQLVKLGWTHLQGCIKNPAVTGRTSFKEVIQERTLREKLRALNLRDGKPWLDDERISEAISALTRLALQRNLFLETFQFHLLSPVRKVRPMVSLLGPSNKPNHHFNIKGPHRQDCS